MDKGTILKQLKSVDNPSFFTLGGKEIAKDLQELLTEDETVQGFVEIFEKNIGRVFSNGARKNGLRSYLVITDRNVFFIRRGRLSLNLITALDKTIAIPIMQIPLHRITDSASNGSVFPVVTEHFSASSDHAFL